MKVLVTGASGFLGGFVVERLLRGGHDVSALVRRSSRAERLSEMGVEIVRGDLSDRDSLDRAVDGVETVIHAAATMSGVAQAFQAGTVEGTRNLLEAAEQANVRRFVHISSIAVLKAKPDKGGAVLEDGPYEEDPARLGLYAQSKLDAERAAVECAGRGRMEVVILRPGILYGPKGKWVLPRLGFAAGANRFLLVGMGGNRLPVCYVDNCAHAAVLAAEKADLDGGAFNIVDDEAFTQIGYLKRIKKDAKPRLKIVRIPYMMWRALGLASGLGLKMLGKANPLAPSHLKACVKRIRYSNEKAKSVLGWRPETGAEEALAETARWLKDSERVSRRADIKALGKPAEGLPPVKACLVGCGVIAETHLEILRTMKNARPLALCDLNQEAAKALAGRFGGLNTYSDMAAMLDAEKPDVLHVLTPPQTHAEYAKLAAKRGCHAYVEKPMAMDAAEARRMADCAERNGVQICVGHNHLFDPTVVKARRIVESGALGEILWVESYYGFNLGENPASRYMLPGGENHWTFGLPGGLYQNLAAHPLCLALELLGPPSAVRAHARYGRVLPAAPTDELRILMETENASGLVTVSLAACPRRQYLNVFGTNMTLHVDLLNKWVIPDGAMRGVPKPIARAMMNMRAGRTVLAGTLAGMFKVIVGKWTPFDGMALLLQEFYGALQRGEPAPVGAEEGVATMEVMDQAWRDIGEESLRWPSEKPSSAEPVAAGPLQ